jgi:hypothetical protein
MYTTGGPVLLTVVVLVMVIPVLLLLALVLLLLPVGVVGVVVVPKNPRMLVDDEGMVVMLALLPAVAVVALRAMMTLKKCVGTWMSRGKVPTAWCRGWGDRKR